MLAFIVSGTLLDVFDQALEQLDIKTPFGAPSAPLEVHNVGGSHCLALFRHGRDASIAAHRVNYRANVWALKEAGATQVVAYATTGSIDREIQIGSFVVPDQIIDYTNGRAGSFQVDGVKEHFDFTFPFSQTLRASVIDAAIGAKLAPLASGTYACTQGPRYETAAEIDKYRRDGCSIVGMTLMPEAALGRQIELEYAALALVMNPGAGIHGEAVDIPGSTRFTDEAVLPIRCFNQEIVQRI